METFTPYMVKRDKDILQGIDAGTYSVTSPIVTATSVIATTAQVTTINGIRFFAGTAATPSTALFQYNKGDIYIDTNTPDIQICSAAGIAGAATWKKITRAA